MADWSDEMLECRCQWLGRSDNHLTHAITHTRVHDQFLITPVKKGQIRVSLAGHGNQSQSYGASAAHVNTQSLNPSNAGRYSIYLSQRDGRLG